MPLIKSPSKAAFKENIRTEMHAGKPQKQALAIAFSVKRRSHADGGHILGDNTMQANDILRRARAARYQAGGEVDPAAVHLTAKPLYDEYVIEGGTLPYEEWAAQQPTTVHPAQTTQQAGTVDPGLLARFRRMLMGRAAGGPVVRQMMGPATSGDSAQHIDAVRQMLAHMGAQHFAEGGPVLHHLDPAESGGFTHETADGVHTYADGGMIAPPGAAPHPMMPPPGGMAAPPGGMMAGPPGSPGATAGTPIGALAQMGQELLKQQQGLSQAYNIPAGAPAPLPTGTPAGGPPMGGAGLPPSGGAPGGGVPPSPQLMALLQQKLGPHRLAHGGPVSGDMMKMALRHPAIMRKYCGGGIVKYTK